ncbi:MAG: MBL fold metallo-hydrolase [Candidatus Bathyarchaeia archaeon]
MLIIPLTVGFLSTKCYIVVCQETLEALVVDPGFSEYEGKNILEEIKKSGFHVKYVVNTHGHADHISGNFMVKETTGAKIIIHYKDAEMLNDPLKNLSVMMGLIITSPPPDILVQDGDKISVGSLEFMVIHTPGHTPGSIALHCKKEKVLFTGDTLFEGSVGRTDLPGASHEMLIQSIRGKLLSLPDETIVYPGHGEDTTIGRERRWNPFITSL